MSSEEDEWRLTRVSNTSLSTNSDLSSELGHRERRRHVKSLRKLAPRSTCDWTLHGKSFCRHPSVPSLNLEGEEESVKVKIKSVKEERYQLKGRGGRTETIHFIRTTTKRVSTHFCFSRSHEDLLFLCRSPLVSSPTS